MDRALEGVENLNTSKGNITLEAPSNEKRRKGLNNADKPGVEGLRLGRYPFTAATNFYLQSRKGTIADSTYTEDERKLRYLGKVLQKMKEDGLIDTTDPRAMGRKEIQEFLIWMKREALDLDTQKKYLHHLSALLRFAKNHIIDEMRVDGVKFPKSPKKPIRTIEVDDLQAIFRTVDHMEGWRGSMARGMVALYFATGVRPKELRLAHLEDLNLKKMTLFIRHPKGEGSWAAATTIDIIRPDMLPLIKQFLEEREKLIANRGIPKALALFPNLTQGPNGFYSANHFGKVKRDIEGLCDVSFRLKDFRPTLTSLTVNGDLSRLPAMSAQLRHSSYSTTQRYYLKMEQGAAGKQLKDAWKDSPILAPNNAITPVIEKKFDISGYS